MARQPWWPQTLPEQTAKAQNIKDKINGYSSALGLGIPDVGAITAVCTAIIDSQAFRNTTEATSQAVTEWRDQVFYGTPKGSAVSAAPVFAVKGAVTYTRGSVTQLFDWRDNILTRPGYTTAIGEDLGFIGAEADAPDLGTFKPTLTAHPAQTDFLYSVIVGNRGGSDQWELEYRPSGGAWTSAGTFTGKSSDVTYNSPSPDDPAVLDLRVQLKKKNENYGQLSDTVSVTVNP